MQLSIYVAHTYIWSRIQELDSDDLIIVSTRDLMSFGSEYFYWSREFLRLTFHVDLCCGESVRMNEFGVEQCSSDSSTVRVAGTEQLNLSAIKCKHCETMWRFDTWIFSSYLTRIVICAVLYVVVGVIILFLLEFVWYALFT